MSVVARSVVDMTTSILTGRQGPATRRIRDGYWRVTAAAGFVLGYVEQLDDEGVPRFRARRLLPSMRQMEIGDFWGFDEAVECLR